MIILLRKYLLILIHQNILHLSSYTTIIAYIGYKKLFLVIILKITCLN